MNKQDRHAAIRERAQEALRDLYHNATPRYPRNVADEHQEIFEEWFQDAASFEIEYMQDGGAYGKNYRATLEHKCNAGKYASKAAQAYYVRKGMRSMQLDRAKGGKWERIAEYGKLYTYGRGGRTLAPGKLVRMRGGSSFAIKEDYFDDLPIGACVDALLVIEAFNAYVADWCKSVPEMWAAYVREELVATTDEAACLSET